MATEWEARFQEASRECDLAKVSDACERARQAINVRLTELAAQTIAIEKERERLYEALRSLLMHEFGLQPPS
jgi:hypothetical protein